MRTGPADRPAALIPVVDWATRLDFGLHSIASERCRAAAAKPENGEAAAIYACAWVTPRHPTRRSGKLSVQKRSKGQVEKTPLYYLPLICRNQHTQHWRSQTSRVGAFF